MERTCSLPRADEGPTSATRLRCRSPIADLQSVLDAQRDLQSVFRHEFFVGENLARRAVGLNSSLVEDDHAPALFCDELEVVAGDDLGCRAVLQNLDQPATGARIQIA